MQPAAHPLPDARIEGAKRHQAACEKASEVTGHEPSLEYATFSSYLSGYDDAMGRRLPEMLEENTALHCRVIELEDALERLQSRLDYFTTPR